MAAAAAAAVRRRKPLSQSPRGEGGGRGDCGRTDGPKGRAEEDGRGRSEKCEGDAAEQQLNHNHSFVVVIRITISRKRSNLSRGRNNTFLFHRKRDERRTFSAAGAEKAEGSHRNLWYPAEKYYVSRRRLCPYSAFVTRSLSTQQCFAVAHNPQMRPPLPPPPPQLLRRRQAIAHNNLPRQYFFLR